MLKDTLIALLIRFVVTAAICPFFIPILHRMKFGQMVRDDGPQAHLKKTGTPTMGGITFMIGILAASLFLIPRYKEVTVVFLFTISYGIIGYAENKEKAVRRLEVISEVYTSVDSQCCFYSISVQNVRI